MKRGVSIGLILIFAFHLAGFYCYFFIRMSDIRREIRKELALLPEENLDRIIIPASEFEQEWLEELEMKWQGKMYDIARIRVDGPNLIVSCLHDEAEDNLLSLLDEILKRSTEDAQGTPSSLIDFLQLEYVADIAPSVDQGDSLHLSFTPYTQSYSSFNKVIDGPPPRL